MSALKWMSVKLKKLMEGKDKKKLLENIVILIILGIILVIAGGTLFGGDGNEKEQQPLEERSGVQSVANNLENEIKEELESKIADILTLIDGAGRVAVAVTFESGNEMVPALDTKRSESSTSEKDSGGGTRQIDQNDYEGNVVYEENKDGSKKPVVIKEKYPVVKGVVIVADGAGDPVVKQELCNAVQVLTDIPLHKIQVSIRKK